jgi:CRP-like cAMP-binding protein
MLNVTVMNKLALENHVSGRIDFTKDEMNQFVSAFDQNFLKRRQLIVQPGFVANYRYYVVNGALRAYVLDGKGEEHTIQFAIDDWWISDYNSYIFKQPATMFVTVVEDSSVLCINREKEEELKKGNHKFETFFRITAERSTAFMQRRLITNLTKTAEERLEEFETKYGLILQRMPQYAVASYLGMTSEYLSKLRNKHSLHKS